MPSQRESRLRHARHYLARLKALEGRYLRAGEEALECLLTLDDCWPQIAWGQQWAAAHRATDP
jgi:hypothetical protein